VEGSLSSPIRGFEGGPVRKARLFRNSDECYIRKEASWVDAAVRRKEASRRRCSDVCAVGGRLGAVSKGKAYKPVSGVLWVLLRISPEARHSPGIVQA
jgi:hypothetical protein